MRGWDIGWNPLKNGLDLEWMSRGSIVRLKRERKKRYESDHLSVKKELQFENRKLFLENQELKTTLGTSIGFYSLDLKLSY